MAQPPRPLKPLRAHVTGALRGQFRKFDARRDLIIGAFLDLIVFILHEDFGISYVASLLIPLVAILVLDAGRKFAKALCIVYRGRDESFRETVKVLVAIAFGGFICAAVIWYGNYKTSPHFSLSIGTGFYARASGHIAGAYIIGSSREEPYPNTEVVFLSVVLTNSGIPSSAKNWHLRVKVHGQYLDGMPREATNEFVDPKDSSKSIFRYTPFDMIFGKTSVPFTDMRQGIADFIILGASHDVVREPGNKLILSCQDDHGKIASFEEKVSAKEMVFMQHQ